MKKLVTASSRAMNRRDFILGAASAASFPLLGGSSDGVRLRVGIVTDTHVENTAHVEHFESALRYFRDRGVEQMLPLDDRVRRTNRQGLVMSVYDDRIVFERRDFTNDVELGDPWIVPIPVGRGKPYAWNVRETTMPVPQFAPGETVEAKTLVGRDRRYNLSIQMALDFPTARHGGVRAYDYEIRSETERGDSKVLCRIVSPTYNRGPSCECAVQRALVSVRELPEGTPYRFAVYPRNCFGKAGEPIRSRVWTRHPAEEIPE